MPAPPSAASPLTWFVRTPPRAVDAVLEPPDGPSALDDPHDVLDLVELLRTPTLVPLDAPVWASRPHTESSEAPAVEPAEPAIEERVAADVSAPIEVLDLTPTAESLHADAWFLADDAGAGADAPAAPQPSTAGSLPLAAVSAEPDDLTRDRAPVNEARRAVDRSRALGRTR